MHVALNENAVLPIQDGQLNLIQVRPDDLNVIALRYIIQLQQQQIQTLHAENAELRILERNRNSPAIQQGRVVRILHKVGKCVFWVVFSVGIGFIIWKCIRYNKSYISQQEIMKKPLIIGKKLYESPIFRPFRDMWESKDTGVVKERWRQIMSLGKDFVDSLIAFLFIEVRDFFKTALTQKTISTATQETVAVTSSALHETVSSISSAVPETVAVISTSGVPEAVSAITADTLGSVTFDVQNTSIRANLGRSIISDRDVAGLCVGATLAGVKATVGLFSRGSLGPF